MNKRIISALIIGALVGSAAVAAAKKSGTRGARIIVTQTKQRGMKAWDPDAGYPKYKVPDHIVRATFTNEYNPQAQAEFAHWVKYGHGTKQGN